MSSAAKKLIGTTALEQAAAGPTDPETVLLLTGDGTDGAQNNTFLDSSSNNHTITRNGNVTQGTFTPFSKEEGKWGNYFDGDGDYLEIPSSSAFNFGTGDFTIELWAYKNTTDLFLRLFGNQSDANEENTFNAFQTSDGLNYTFQAGTTEVTTNTSIPINVWHHIAFVRESGTLTIFIDGTPEASGNLNNDFDTVNNFIVAQTTALYSERDFNGNISNLRIVKGTAVYTSTFTPPTEPLTAISGTSLLTCQSNRFVDNSSNNHDITVNGDPEVTTFSPFANSTGYDPAVVGGSGYFDGDGDYLQLADSDDWDIGADDFTIDGWIYKEDKGDGSTLIGQRQGGFDEWRILLDYGGTGDFRFDWESDNYSFSGANIPNNAWTHFALVRNGNTGTLYINGTSVDATTLNNISNYSAPLIIGARDNSSEFYLGYISNLRVVKGTAIAPSSVPTAPLTEVSGTSLLCNFTNAGIIDSSSSNVIETVGNAQIDTTVVKYGTGAMEFDGAEDSLEIPSSPQLGFVEGEKWTMEMWVYPDGNYADFNTLISKRPSGPNSPYALFLDKTTGELAFFNGTQYTSTSAPNSSVWSHVAYVYDGTNLNIYLNGTSVLSTEVTMYDSSAAVTTIGKRPDTDTEYFYGYIDDLRITKGLARYTTNFTPPGALIEQ